MKGLKLRLLIAGLAVGSFAACSTHKPNRSGASVTENRLQSGFDSPATLAKDKPSPCIKWSSDSDRIRKKLRRADKSSIEPRTEALSRKNKVQAED